jgi:hypothetical protein
VCFGDGGAGAGVELIDWSKMVGAGVDVRVQIGLMQGRREKAKLNVLTFLIVLEKDEYMMTPPPLGAKSADEKFMGTRKAKKIRIAVVWPLVKLDSDIERI